MAKITNRKRKVVKKIPKKPTVSKTVKTLIAEFNTELNTASQINAKCVTHNVDLNDSFNYIGHLSTLSNEKHIIHVELNNGKTIQLQPVMSYKSVKTIKKEQANV